MKSTNPKDEKTARLVAAGFGVLWTIMAFSITADSPWPVARIAFPGFGLLFIIGALTMHGSKGRESDSEESTSMDSPGEADRKEQKKYVYCPYCGTAQEEDYKICESCGAGRKGK